MISGAEREVRDEVAKLTLQVARPIIWHDPRVGFPKAIEGATCFFLRFEGGIVGITADHVVTTYEAALAITPGIVCQLKASRPIDLLGSIVARDERLDLATFTVSEEVVGQAEAVALDCRGDWPPPMPQRGCLLSACGFPELIREVDAQGVGQFKAYGALAAVDDVTDWDIITTYEPERDLDSGLAPKPPLGFNMSGCSGGPVLAHGLRNGLLRWFPVGMIVRGPRGDGSRLFDGVDIIHSRRIDFIRPDGTIGAP